MSSITKLLFAASLSLAFVQLGFSASTTGLADWCFNINGDISSSCNGAGPAPAGFDSTLEGTGPNILGSASFTVLAGQYALGYMDYDLDFFNTPSAGFAQDSGSVFGAPAPGVQTYELDDPNTSNIFSDFASNSLMNTNNVTTYSPAGSGSPCCDVSWAIGFNNTTGMDGTVTFTVSTTAPVSTFYLIQTNGIYGDSIYLSESFTPSTITPPPPVPEPAAWLLAGPALVFLYILKRRQTAAVADNT